uniref:Uncharacterized protein n=1 Tax=viral metagenome TaxID=1070528 RepID=A0A6C0JKZ1_9ZZZZ
MSSLSNIFNNIKYKFSDNEKKAITNFYDSDLIEENLKKKFIDDLKNVVSDEEGSEFVNTMKHKYKPGTGGKRKRTKINKSRKNRTKSKRKRFV